MMPARSSAALTIGLDCRFIQDKYHGIGRYTYHLLNHLGRLEGAHRVVAFVDPSLPNSRFPLDTLTQLEKLTISAISIPLYHPSELWAWRATLRIVHLDLFHSPYFWSPWLTVCPLVTTIHDMIFDRYPAYMPHRRFAMLYKVSSRMSIRKARRVIAVSNATRRDILAFVGASASKVVVVPEGVDPLFRPVDDIQIRQRVRRRYDLPEKYILALGARRPHKNIDRLVAGFGRIAADVPHSLVLVGTIDDRFAASGGDEIARLKRMGKVIEIGYVVEQDLPALYSMADLFVQPSIIEGFGLPVLEAMACGCPVACSNTSSLPEVADDAAVLFDPQSTDAIAETLRRLLNSPELCQNLTLSGLQRARQFTWQQAAAKTFEVYRQAVEEL